MQTVSASIDSIIDRSAPDDTANDDNNRVSSDTNSNDFDNIDANTAQEFFVDNNLLSPTETTLDMQDVETIPEVNQQDIYNDDTVNQNNVFDPELVENNNLDSLDSRSDIESIEDVE